MIFKGQEILDMSDKELADNSMYLTILLAERENRLRDVKERHKNFNFNNINPAFVKIQTEINDELKLRSSRT